MCQSAKTSLIAWLITSIIALLIISTGKKNGKWNGIFILTFILVQLLEFFIWYDRKNNNLTSSADEALQKGKSANENKPSSDVFVRLILIALWLQPLAQTYMAYKHGNGYKKQLLIATMVYFVMFIWSITQALDRDAKFSAQPSLDDESSTCITCNGGKVKDGEKVSGCAGGHLVWSRSNSESFIGPGPAGAIYIFGLFFGLFFMKPKMFGIMLTVLGGMMVFYTAREHQKNDFSTMWCLYASFYAILALMMAYSRKN